MNDFARLATLALLIEALPLLAQYPRLDSGPATLLTTASSYAEAPGDQRIGTAVPTDGGWISVLVDGVAISPGESEWRLIATRLMPDGTVRDTIGRRIATERDYTRFTAVPASGGARVYWVLSQRSGCTLRTATVSDEGEISEPLVVGAFPLDAALPALSVAVSGSRTALHLDRYVMILDGATLLKTVDLGGFGDPSTIVATGAHFVVTWVASGNVLMRQTLDLDGNVVGPPGGTGVASPGLANDVASDGVKVLFAWSDEVSMRLGVLDPATGQFAEKGIVVPEYAAPQAVWTGSSYLVTWMSWAEYALVGVHVSPEGEILDAQPIRLFEGDPFYFVLVARGSELMLLRQTGGCVRFACETDVVATTLGGASPTDHLISAAARQQGYPAVATDGSDFLAVWSENHQLFAAATNGQSRAPASPIALGEVLGDFGIVAGGGAGYLAAWTGFHDGAYSVEGRVLIPTNDAFAVKPVSIPGHDYFPSNVAAGGSPAMYLLAWREGDKNVAMRIGSDGELIDTAPLTLFDSPYALASPSIAFDGADFIVAWSTIYGSPSDQYLVRTVRVGLDGIVRVDRLWSSSANANYQGPTVRCGAGTCLIVWGERPSDAASPWRIVGQRFRNDGSLIDAIPFDIDASNRTQTLPSVAWDGERFVVNWRKYVGDVGIERVEFQVIPARSEVDLGPLDLVVERDNVSASPVTACNLRGRCILVAPGFVDDTVLGRTSRLFKRFFGAGRYRGVRR